MTQREAFLTSEGLSRLEVELWHLRTVRRQEVAQRIQGAKGVGGTVDNADYEEAKNEQAFVEGRILTLENTIKKAVLIPDDRVPSGSVELGALVTLLDPRGKTLTYTIVGSTEADPPQGRISNESPVGKALLGRKVGEEAEVTTPAGVSKFNIIKIE